MAIYSVVNPSGKRRYGVSYSYFDENGEKKWKRKIIGTRKEAEAEWDRIKRGDLLRGIFEDLSQKKIPTFTEAANAFLESYVSELRAPKTPRSFMTKFKKRWGNRLVTEISREEIIDYGRKALSEGKTVSSLQRELGVLRFFFEWTAQRQGLELPNVAKGVLRFISPAIRREARRKQEEKSWEYWTEEEIAKMIEVATPYEKLMLRWALCSLMRRSEILNARWEDIDRDRKILNIPRTKTEVPREIPLKGTLHDILDEVGWKDKGPIFKKIRLFDHKGFQCLVERAGIERKRGKGFHKLRHSAATFLSKIGISEQIVQRLGGWKNSAVLRMIYEHVGQTINEKSIAVDALSRYELQILYRSDQEPTKSISSQTLVNQGIITS